MKENKRPHRHTNSRSSTTSSSGSSGFLEEHCSLFATDEQIERLKMSSSSRKRRRDGSSVGGDSIKRRKHGHRRPTSPLCDVSYKWSTTPAPQEVSAIVDTGASARSSRRNTAAGRSMRAQNRRQQKAATLHAERKEEHSMKIRIPWARLQKRYPNGWQSLRRLNPHPAAVAGGPQPAVEQRKTRARVAIEKQREAEAKMQPQNSDATDSPRAPTNGRVARTPRGPGPSQSQQCLLTQYPDGLFYKEPISWDDEEDNKLVAAIGNVLHSKNFSLVASYLNNDPHVRGRMRTAKQCLERYVVLKAKNKPRECRTPEEHAIVQRDAQRKSELDRQCRERALRYRDQPLGAPFVNGVQNLCASFSQMSVHAHFKRAMTAVNNQRQACKNALRASLSELNDTSAKAIMQIVHASHHASLREGRHQLGVPSSVPVKKTLTPRQIIELRQRRNRHLIRHRQLMAHNGQYQARHGADARGLGRGGGSSQSRPGSQQAPSQQQQSQQNGAASQQQRLPQQQGAQGTLPRQPGQQRGDQQNMSSMGNAGLVQNGARAAPQNPPGGVPLDARNSPRFPSQNQGHRRVVQGQGGGNYSANNGQVGIPGQQQSQSSQVTTAAIKHNAEILVSRFPRAAAQVQRIFHNATMPNHQKARLMSNLLRQLRDQQHRQQQHQAAQQHRQQQQQHQVAQQQQHQVAQHQSVAASMSQSSTLPQQPVRGIGGPQLGGAMGQLPATSAPLGSSIIRGARSVASAPQLAQMRANAGGVPGQYNPAAIGGIGGAPGAGMNPLPMHNYQQQQQRLQQQQQLRQMAAQQQHLQQQQNMAAAAGVGGMSLQQRQEQLRLMQMRQQQMHRQR